MQKKDIFFPSAKEWITSIKDDISNGGSISEEDAYRLLDIDTDLLWDVACAVNDKLQPKVFDSCSIINARSGKCSENCKWCAQSAHYDTGCENYDIVDRKLCIEMAEFYARNGVHRFSLVASGRGVKGKALDMVCDYNKEMKERCNIYLCASLGLLDEHDLQKLWDSGVRRYHCNLETAPSHFPTLCTTHTIDDKIATIRAARRIGFEICSGGIIGMGETARQRVEFALTLRDIDPDSIPINILCPIPGTPLAELPPLTDDEILTAIAIFRIVNPRAQLRFAGGRMNLSPAGQLKALRIGINGAIVGDLLTTVGSRIEQDRKLASEAGYRF